MIDGRQLAPGRAPNCRASGAAPARASAPRGGVEAEPPARADAYDVVCLSHLRWEWVTWQRPQHLLSRLARDRRVFYFEEPVAVDDGPARLAVREPTDNVWVATPLVPPDLGGTETVASGRRWRANGSAIAS